MDLSMAVKQHLFRGVLDGPVVVGLPHSFHTMASRPKTL